MASSLRPSSGNSTRKKKDRQTEKAMGRQHKRMDRLDEVLNSAKDRAFFLATLRSMAKLMQQLDNAKESIGRLKEENAKYQARLETKESEIKKLTEKLGFFPKGILEIFKRSYIDVRKKNINFLLLGRSGFGKSALGNSILQRKCFKDGCSSGEIHTDVQCEIREFNGRGIGVFELPDIRYESDEKQSEALFKLTREKIEDQCLHGFPVVLLLLRFGCKITHEYFFLIENFKTTFGKNSLKDSGILVVTNGDHWKLEFEEKSFQDWIQDQRHFKEILTECNGRALLFDNRTQVKQEQTEQLQNLMDMVDKLILNHTFQFKTLKF